MKGPISLAEELRAIRGGSNNRSMFKRAPEPQDSGTPWQADIERMERSLQEVLKAVSQLSGVELPDVVPASTGEGDSLPVLDINTLKDRIRNDLEVFSVNTATDLAKQAEEQTRAALGELQKEVSGQVDQVASQLREKLQGGLGQEEMGIDLVQLSKDRVAGLVQEKTDEFARWVWLTCKGTDAPIPSQVEKLLEPYVEEASARFTESFEKKIQGLLAEQEQRVQEKLETTRQTIQSQLDSLEQASLRVCEQSANLVTTQSTDKLNAAADEVVKGFQGRLEGEIEGALGRFQSRMAETSAAAQQGLQHEQDLRVENFRQRLDGVVGEAHEKSLSEVSGRMAHATADLVESSIQHVHQQMEDSLEHSREEISAFIHLQEEEAKQRIQGLGAETRESLMQDTDRVAGSLSGLDEELNGICDRHIADSRQQLDSVVQECMNSTTERIRQAVESQMEEINRVVRDSQDAAASQYASRLQDITEGRFNDVMEHIQQETGEAGSRVAVEVKTTSETAIRELSEKVNASAAMLREETVRATSRIESAVKESLEAFRQQLNQLTHAGLEEQQKALMGNIAELQTRLVHAAEMLLPGDSKAQ